MMNIEITLQTADKLGYGVKRGDFNRNALECLRVICRDRKLIVILLTNEIWPTIDLMELNSVPKMIIRMSMMP